MGINQSDDLYVSSSLTVTAAAASPGVMILGADPERKEFWVFNDSPNPLFLKMGLSGTSADYNLQIPSLGLYESSDAAYTGILWGVWAAATGSVKVTSIF